MPSKIASRARSLLPREQYFSEAPLFFAHHPRGGGRGPGRWFQLVARRATPEAGDVGEYWYEMMGRAEWRCRFLLVGRRNTGLGASSVCFKGKFWNVFRRRS